MIASIHICPSTSEAPPRVAPKGALKDVLAAVPKAPLDPMVIDELAETLAIIDEATFALELDPAPMPISTPILQALRASTS